MAAAATQRRKQQGPGQRDERDRADRERRHRRAPASSAARATARPPKAAGAVASARRRRMLAASTNAASASSRNGPVQSSAVMVVEGRPVEDEFAVALDHEVDDLRVRLRPAAACCGSACAGPPPASACDAASVSFWHTRQRSSSAIASTRASSAGSRGQRLRPRWRARRRSMPGRAARQGRRSASSARDACVMPSSLLTSGRIVVAQHLGRHRADQLVADHAGLVDHEGLGHAVDAVVDADQAVGVGQRRDVRVAEPRPASRSASAALVLVVEAVDRHHAAASRGRPAAGCSSRQAAHHEAQTLSSQTWPRRSCGDSRAVGRAQQRQAEGRRGLADQRRRQLRAASASGPTARKPSSTTKTSQRQRGSVSSCAALLRQRGVPRGPRRRRARRWRRLRRGRTRAVAAVEHRQQRRRAPSAGSRPRSSRRRACSRRARSRRRRRAARRATRTGRA